MARAILFAVSVLLAAAAADAAVFTYPPDPAQNYGPVLPSTNGTDNGGLPQQIHLTVWGAPSTFLVTFTVGAPTVTPDAPTAADLPNLRRSRPLVAWGEAGAVAAGKAKTATAVRPTTRDAAHARADAGRAIAYSFSNSWDFQGPGERQGYVSGAINHVLLRGLKPGVTYSYRVSAGKDQPFSPWLSFSTPPAGFPATVGLMGDFGNSKNGTDTMLAMLAKKPHVVHLQLGKKPHVVHVLGDFSDADSYLPGGEWAGGAKPKGWSMTTHQPAWDQWAADMQPLFTAIPIQTTPGNHELELQPPMIGGSVFAAYNARYPIPQSANPLRQTAPLKMVDNSTVLKPSEATNMYYAYSLPGVARFIFITSYIPSDHYGSGTAQYKWLERELKRFNRKKTPWVVLNMHAPWYTSWAGSFKDTECMRLTYEPLLLKYGVDLVFNGHTHSYERFLPVYNNTKADCGPIHITVGMGGKPGNPPDGVAALDNEPIEQVTWPYCNSAEMWIQKLQSKITLMGNACPTVQPDLNNGSATDICWRAQPPFSAMRNAAYGMGTIEFVSASVAKWRMFRNVDGGAAFEEVTFDRSQPASCFSKDAKQLPAGVIAEPAGR
ncbi:MAG: Metallo-dependent phosphatase-like protein [Monoraphidium minutum]|nr:MAG: Metallo-dependent phosphatase-like protein [Monoraphidium minutum]